MTLKEEAAELISKYKNAPFNCKGCDMPYCDVPCTMLSWGEAKQCALIAIEELIKAFEYKRGDFGDDCATTWLHYKKLKQEIIDYDPNK